MPMDNSDETVFRSPTIGGDRTLIRPTPGGHGSGGRVSTATQSVSRSDRQDFSRPAVAEPGASMATFSGLNPLVAAASTLIAVYAKTRQCLTHSDVGALHQGLVRTIRDFDTRARDEGIRPEIVLAARYALCTALDEAVLNTPWGSESGWPQRTLLSVFHNETAGGEKFFLILERVKQQPAANLHMLELLYILLSLGFEGKYRVIHRGREKIEELRDELFGIIRQQKGDYERELSRARQAVGERRNKLEQWVPLWVVASVVGALLFLGYSGLRIWLFNASLPVVTQLETLADPRPGGPSAPADTSLPM